nr:hypothetical protein Itr_chr02CG14660 [Ipomoea trifida]
MLCNVDDELNVDASLLDLNDVEFDTFHDNCLDDAIYIHDLLGEEKEEMDEDLRDVLLRSEKEEEKESVTIEKGNEEENFENKNVLFEEVHCKIIEGEKKKTSDESVREEVDEKSLISSTKLATSGRTCTRIVGVSTLLSRSTAIACRICLVASCLRAFLCLGSGVDCLSAPLLVSWVSDILEVRM